MHDPGVRPSALKKSLGLAQLSLYGIGTIIGAGIYSVMAPAAAEAGNALWISFFLAALISALSALSYAEIASALPGAGGEHHFLRKTFPHIPALAFLVGLFISIHGAAVLATVALTFGNYFEQISGIAPAITALGMMALMTAINVKGMSDASRLYTGLTVLQVSCLILFAVIALASDGAGERISSVLVPPEDWAGILQGTAIVFFIYTGYEHMATLTEEARHPGRDIWRAFIVALVVTSIVYGLILFAVLATLDSSTLAGAVAPLALAASQHSAVLGHVILGAALLATANAVLSGSLSGSRMLFGMARDGDLPRVFGITFGQQKSPLAAALLFVGVAALFIAIGRIELVASLSSLGALLVFVMINFAVIVLRYTQPELKRPFRLASIGRFPITAALGILASVAIGAQFDLRVYLIFGIATVIGLTSYLLLRRRDSAERAR